MKLNILYNDDRVRQGYLNIDPFANNKESVRVGDPKNLDEFVDDGECVEIVALDVLDHYPSTEVDNVLMHWLSKLRHGGIITIGGNDFDSISSAYKMGRIDLIKLNELLYGLQGEDASYQYSCLSINTMIDFLQGQGLKVIMKRVNKYKFVVKAERP